MVTLEQIKLLESRVSRALEIVNRVTEENTFLKGKLETYQQRIDELEVLIQRFKEDQTRIEEGILSALERLGRFEEAVENTVKQVSGGESQPARAQAADSPAGTSDGAAPAGNERAPATSAGTLRTARKPVEPVATYIPADEDADDSLIFDETGEENAEDDEDDGSSGVSSAELDIF